VLHVLTSEFDVGPDSIVPALTGSLGFDPVDHFASCFPKHLFKQASACQRSKDIRKRRKAMMSFLSLRGQLQVTKRPAAAVLTSQAEPRFIKVHKSRTSAKQSKQSTRRYLLTVLAKKPALTAKVGGRGSAKKDGAQLRCSSPELFGRCLGPFNGSKCG
jgi:hypothetical protein